jgi:hypothetical protein
MTHAETVNAPARGVTVARTMTLALAWFFVALWLALSGALRGRGGPPLALGAAILTPLLLYWLDGRRGHPWLGGIARLDSPTLALLQTFRVVGVTFLIAWARGALPAGFALPAGVGDVCVGLAAPFVGAALASDKPYARRLFLAWNVVGVVDLVTAVTLGVAHSPSTFGFLATTPTTGILATYPFSMVPSFFVPLALILHFVGLARLRRELGAR